MVPDVQPSVDQGGRIPRLLSIKNMEHAKLDQFVGLRPDQNDISIFREHDDEPIRHKQLTMPVLAARLGLPRAFPFRLAGFGIDAGEEAFIET